MPVFTPGFYAKLMQELENFEESDLPKGRPNTMNRGGVSGELLQGGSVQNIHTKWELCYLPLSCLQ